VDGKNTSSGKEYFQTRRMLVGRRLRLLTLVALAVAGLAAGVLVSGGGATTTVVVPKKITVTASEFKFVLSKKTLPAGSTVIFTVVNKGKIPHDFKIAGKKTKTLKKGQKTTLRVTLPKKKGAIAFLCTLPGHAPAGMKGKFGVGVAAPKPVPTTPRPTTTTTTTTTPTSTGPETLEGDPVAGRGVFNANGCASCHTMAAAGANGTVGPNLDVAKPGQARVRQFVQNGSTSGGTVMPAFSSMSQTDLNNIAAFVYASTHP
jgi:cytochrome c6